jgi:chromosome segregation ATPase
LSIKSSTGLNAPVHPKIISNGQFSQKDLPSLLDKNGSVDQDWASELRNADGKCKQLIIKLDEQLMNNKQMGSDLNTAKGMIESRDKEINRLSMLYESNINLDKLNINYTLEKVQKQNENLQKQLEFLNTENNKLADMHKENMTMSENYKCNQSEVKRLNTKLLGKEEEIIRLKQSADSKAEQIKRLTEQYNNSQKPAL